MRRLLPSAFRLLPSSYWLLASGFWLLPPMKDPRFAKAVVFVNAALPLAIIGTDWWNDRLGANPLEFFTNSTGLLTLIFLTLSLAVTPLRKLTGWNFLSHF